MSGRIASAPSSPPVKILFTYGKILFTGKTTFVGALVFKQDATLKEFRDTVALLCK
jgi:hypothetical protein